MSDIFILYLFFLLLLSPILKSENMNLKYIILSENKLPESRLLLDGQKEKIDNKIKKKSLNENRLEKINKKELKSKKKTVLKKNYEFKVNFTQEKERPSVEEIKSFYDNLVKLNKKDSITIKGYAQKREGDSTSKVRRLSLKRALFLRSLLLKKTSTLLKFMLRL